MKFGKNKKKNRSLFERQLDDYFLVGPVICILFVHQFITYPCREVEIISAFHNVKICVAWWSLQSIQRTGEFCALLQRVSTRKVIDCGVVSFRFPPRIIIPLLIPESRLTPYARQLPHDYVHI
jgi:hypothetical protein